MIKNKALAMKLSWKYGIKISDAEVDEKGLYKITISDKVKEISSMAFGCFSLTYMYRKEISHVICEDGVTRFDDWAFDERSELTSITIPETVTYIGRG